MTDIQNNLSSYMNTEMEAWDFSGVIRVMKKGATIYEVSRGYSIIEFGIKNTMETRFCVASVTKQFTAFAQL